MTSHPPALAPTVPLRALRLITTRMCPLVCSFCSVNAGPGRQEMMPTASVHAVLSDFLAQGGTEVTLTGGEPLCHPDIAAFAAQAHDAGAQVTMFTMGITDAGESISTREIERLAPLVEIWRFSIHGTTPEKHEDITRGQGSFAATNLAMTRLVERGATVHATFVAKPETLDELLPVARLCADRGVRELRVVAVVPQGRQSRPVTPLSESVLDAIRIASEEVPMDVRLGNAACAQLHIPNECRAFSDELIVSVDGWVSACHMVEPMPSVDEMDNVFRVGLRETLKNSPRLRAVRSVAAGCSGGCSKGCLAMKAAVQTLRVPVLA